MGLTNQGLNLCYANAALQVLKFVIFPLPEIKGAGLVLSPLAFRRTAPQCFINRELLAHRCSNKNNLALVLQAFLSLMQLMEQYAFCGRLANSCLMHVFVAGISRL